MIKLRKGNMIVLGLSHANLDRLRAEGIKAAIKIDGKELGIDVDIFITAGETEAVMFQQFERGIGPNTKIKIEKGFTSS
jgi:hypothetical protein